MEDKNKLIGYGYVSDNIIPNKETIYSLKNVAEIISKPHIGRNKINQLLRDLGYIEQNNYAKVKYIEEGFFINSETRRDFGEFHANTNQILCTVKGLELIKKIVKESVK